MLRYARIISTSVSAEPADAPLRSHYMPLVWPAVRLSTGADLSPVRPVSTRTRDPQVTIRTDQVTCTPDWPRIQVTFSPCAGPVTGHYHKHTAERRESHANHIAVGHTKVKSLGTSVLSQSHFEDLSRLVCTKSFESEGKPRRACIIAESIKFHRLYQQIRRQ